MLRQVKIWGLEPRMKKRTLGFQIVCDLCFAKVPCEICGAHVAFDHYVLHMSTHLQQAEPEADITCDVCGALLGTRAFEL